jgi:hypothetical protein
MCDFGDGEKEHIVKLKWASAAEIKEDPDATVVVSLKGTFMGEKQEQELQEDDEETTIAKNRLM